MRSICFRLLRRLAGPFSSTQLVRPRFCVAERRCSDLNSPFKDLGRFLSSGPGSRAASDRTQDDFVVASIVLLVLARIFIGSTLP
jgi:hypothetical protein